jgi:hypothetical protein
MLMKLMSMSSYDRQQGWEVRLLAYSRTFLHLLTACAYIGTRERHLETILQSSLIQLILVKNFPRSLIQIVLQVESSPENDYVNTKLVQASLVSFFV